MAIYERIPRLTLEELAPLMDTLPASLGPVVGRLLRFKLTALPTPPSRSASRAFDQSRLRRIDDACYS